MTRHVFIVHPPLQGGVTDYSLQLQDALAGRYRCSAAPLGATSPALEPRPGDVVLLQYSGYGYAKRGVPLWLLERVAAWRARGAVLGVYFHELFAYGPPWRSSFWLSPGQRHVARRIAGAAAFWLTSRQRAARWLRQFADRAHAVLPMVSTIGEPVGRSTARQDRVVVFGSAGSRLAAYRAARPALAGWARRHGLEVHDIGHPLEQPGVRAQFRDAHFIEHGWLPPAATRALLAEARFGLLAYPVRDLSKSSIFAAYCAHGLCPIVAAKRHEPSDGLAPGQHYLPFSGDADAWAGSGVAEQAWRWYQPHRLEAHANVYRAMIERAVLR